MSEPVGTVADWVTPEYVRANPAWGADGDPPTDAQVAEAVGVASELLFRKSGRQYPGHITDTVRPVNLSARSGVLTAEGREGYASVGGAPGSGSLYDAGGFCGSELKLVGPVVHVSDVTVDGVSLPDTAWEVSDWRYLVRTDGGAWPVSQNLALPTTQPGTMSVTYTHGVNPPPSGRLAAGRLAAEIAKGLAGLECAVPDRATSVTQQGVTVALIAPPEDWMTGLREVTQFLKAVNPRGDERSARVSRAGGTRLRRTTSTSGS